MQITNYLLNHKLSDLRVKLLYAKLSECTQGWKHVSFIPAFNKFYYICEGDGWIQLDDKRYQPKSGQLFFAPAGVLQSFSVTNAPPVYHVLVPFHFQYQFQSTLPIDWYPEYYHCGE
ncbi:hypothetical protein AB4114_02680 [Paenibacillus sp. 2RAB27]|uniref:hypothetical protein n=1 Tax=Paenibacillus sp. 2RAB27 TaxID=3232991 RepID=UPI003F9469BC